MKRRGTAFLGVLLALCSAVSGIFLQVQAAESQRGRIEIVYRCGTEGPGIQGAEFSAVQIADAEVNQEVAVYTLKQVYRDEDKSLPDPMTPQFRENGKIAENLLSIYQSNQRTDAWIQKTNSEGRAIFPDCPAGIYLIWQSGGDGESAGYETALPFLAELPFREAAEKSWEWKRQVYPKTAEKPRSDVPLMKKEESPALAKEREEMVAERPERGQGTGDESGMWGYLLLAAGAAAGLFLIQRYKSRKRN